MNASDAIELLKQVIVTCAETKDMRKICLRFTLDSRIDTSPVFVIVTNREHIADLVEKLGGDFDCAHGSEDVCGS